MKKAGIRVAMIGNIEQGRQPSGSVKMFSPEWTAATLSSFKDGWVAVPGQEAPNSLAQEVVFNLPEALAKSEVVKLDLGKVNIMATVTLNGKAFETLWMPPFELDVTKALQPGENRLRVQVVSTVPPQPSFGLEIRLLPVSKTTFQ